MLILIQKGKLSDEDEEKKKKKKVKNSFQNMMIPNNIIFNPSLSIPQGAPINNQKQIHLIMI